MWTNIEISPLNAETLSMLINNEIPAIRIPNFSTNKEAEELAERFLKFGSRSNSIETVTRIGISQYEQGAMGGKDNYFRMAEEAWANLEKITETTFNPVTRIMDILRHFFSDVDILWEEGYGRYFAGVAKLRTGYTPIHSDFPLFGSDDWAIAKMRTQLSWNFYLRVPKQGGELKIWDKLWEKEDDEKFLVKGTYYHDEEVIAEARAITIKPSLTEVIILNARNYHTVMPCEHRLAVGSWISLMPDGSLRLWS